MLGTVAMDSGSSILLLGREFMEGKGENTWNGEGICRDHP